MDTEIAAANFPLHVLGKHAMQQSRGLAISALKNGMMSGVQDAVITKVVDSLATRNKYPSHGSVVDHREARDLGLNVTYLPPEDSLWQRIWLLYSMYDFDCSRGKLLKIFEGRARSLAVATSTS